MHISRPVEITSNIVIRTHEVDFFFLYALLVSCSSSTALNSICHLGHGLSECIAYLTVLRIGVTRGLGAFPHSELKK